MLITTRGIIIKSIKFGESSLILDIFTEEIGLKTYIVSGIRSKKAKTKSGILQIMSLVELVAYNKEGSNISRIKEIKADYYYKSIPFEFLKRSVGLFHTEVIQHVLKGQEQNKALFRFLWDSFYFLDTTRDSLRNLPLVFLLQFSKFLGFFPDNSRSETQPIFNLLEGSYTKGFPPTQYDLDEDLSLFLYQLLKSKLETSFELKIPKAIRVILLNKLLFFYQLHMDDFGTIKSLSILSELNN